jgi:magnesium transporter
LLRDLAEPVLATVTAITPRDEVVGLLETHNLADLPVVDIDGRMLGIIYHSTLIQTVQEDATVDMQTMVGASKDERALSTPMFAVRRRLPWLQINLLTAFLAASVVGLFEETITQFTALAVLLPVVAGQSGNAGAQALAVTMRGLALREISLRHWLQVMLKEVQTGFVNGLAIAATCGLGVYFWSGSVGLVVVIAMSMVLAMVAAGFAGALVPIFLTRIGQDPAQSSSIILTTVTDVAGFFSFLGIATLLSGML